MDIGHIFTGARSNKDIVYILKLMLLCNSIKLVTIVIERNIK